MLKYLVILMSALNQTAGKHLTLLVHRIFPIFLFIGLAWGQNTTSLSPIDDRGSDKLVQSFRSDLGKFYTNCLIYYFLLSTYCL